MNSVVRPFGPGPSTGNRNGLPIVEVVSVRWCFKGWGSAMRYQAVRKDLVSIPDNPVPGGHKVSRVVTQDGVGLRAAHWKPAGRENGKVALVLQGRTEFIERYAETVGELLRRGFHVVSFDWRGQGGSARLLPDRAKGHVQRFDDYLFDLDAVLTQIVDPLDGMVKIALAHSMGGAVLLRALQRNGHGFERCVLSAPMIGLSMVNAPKVAGFAAGLLAKLGLSVRYVPGGTAEPTFPFPDNPLTRDASRHAIAGKVFEMAPDLAIGSPTIGWTATSFNAMFDLQHPSVASAIATPILIAASPTDRITSTPVAQAFAERLPNGQFLAIPDAEHEILLEIDPVRATFWQAFDGFIG